MVSKELPQLSKSRFMSGLQCLKRLYLECYHRDLADPTDANQQHLFDVGTAVGELAREIYPAGTLIEEKYFEHAPAEESTASALANNPVDALFESAFSFERIRTRVDILKSAGGQRYDLIEVKSGTRVKEEHIPDIAIQLHVLEGAGLELGQTSLMHINNTYVYDGHSLDLEQLFSADDVTDQVREFASNEIPRHLAAMWETLQLAETPVVETGAHCNKPYACPFIGTCHKKVTEHPVEELPRISPKALGALRALGIQDIRDIPAEFSGLTSNQQRVRDSVVAGNPFIGPDLESSLKGVSSPVSFMDFETFSPAIPMFAGTSPYQTIPFQWSVHIRGDDGMLTHSEFLNEDADDPRERFMQSLLEAIPSEGTIVVYSGYESRILGELADSFPQYAQQLETISGRTFDLLKVIRENYYHPEFHGSNSIKSVLPALVPELSYADLGIQDGSTAGIRYTDMVTDGARPAENAEIKRALLAYCERDTEAMVRVFDVLMAATT